MHVVWEISVILQTYIICTSSGALAEAADNMEVKEAASVKPIDQSPSLCAGEQDYVDRRKRVVLESLNSLGINCSATLTLARDYAAEVKKPFPEIDDQVLEEREWPKDCYVFEGKEKEPTIVYMPLFNRRNCQGL